VLDIDGTDAEAELRKLEKAHGELPPSVEVITARGRHVYFRQPPLTDIRNSASKIGPKIDVRASGGYVLTPPSIHPSGRAYAWSVDCARVIADPPVWLLEKIAAPANGNGTPPDWPTLVAATIHEGARDCTATRLAGHLLRRYVDPRVVLELLQCWNATRCAPPLPAEDICRVVNSIAGKELARRDSNGGRR
jgi:hypothetical protein